MESKISQKINEINKKIEELYKEKKSLESKLIEEERAIRHAEMAQRKNELDRIKQLISDFNGKYGTEYDLSTKSITQNRNVAFSNFLGW